MSSPRFPDSLVILWIVISLSSLLLANENFKVSLREDESSPVVDWNKNESACIINVRLIYDFDIRDKKKSLYDFHFNLVSCEGKDTSTCKDVSLDWPKCQNLCNLENEFASCFKLTANGEGKFIYADLALSQKKHYPEPETKNLYFGLKMHSPLSEEKSISPPFLVSSENCSGGLPTGIIAAIIITPIALTVFIALLLYLFRGRLKNFYESYQKSGDENDGTTNETEPL